MSASLPRKTRYRFDLVETKRLLESGLSMPKVSDAMGISLTRLIHAVSREPALQFARAAGAERAADAIAELADEPCADMIDVAHRKLRVDTRRWLLAKRHPVQFGEQRQPQSDASVAVTVITGVPSPQTLAAPSVPPKRITVEETARAIQADATVQASPTPQTPARSERQGDPRV